MFYRPIGAKVSDPSSVYCLLLNASTEIYNFWQKLATEATVYDDIAKVNFKINQYIISLRQSIFQQSLPVLSTEHSTCVAVILCDIAET